MVFSKLSEANDRTKGQDDAFLLEGRKGDVPINTLRVNSLEGLGTGAFDHVDEGAVEIQRNKERGRRRISLSCRTDGRLERRRSSRRVEQDLKEENRKRQEEMRMSIQKKT